MAIYVTKRHVSYIYILTSNNNALLAEFQSWRPFSTKNIHLCGIYSSVQMYALTQVYSLFPQSHMLLGFNKTEEKPDTKPTWGGGVTLPNSSVRATLLFS